MGFLEIPTELRLQILEYLTYENQARASTMATCAQLRDEFFDILYKDRTLALYTRPHAFRVADTWTEFRQLVEVKLEHAHRLAIQLPMLPWNPRHFDEYNVFLDPMPFPFRYFDHGSIDIHVYESPDDDQAQTAVSHWCIQLIKRVFDLFNPRHVDIIAHPRSAEGNSFTRNQKFINEDPNDFLSLGSFWSRASGDLAFILFPLWWYSKIEMDIHTSSANIRRLLKLGFVYPIDPRNARWQAIRNAQQRLMQRDLCSPLRVTSHSYSRSDPEITICPPLQSVNVPCKYQFGATARFVGLGAEPESRCKWADPVGVGLLTYEHIGSGVDTYLKEVCDHEECDGKLCTYYRVTGKWSAPSLRWWRTEGMTSEWAREQWE